MAKKERFEYNPQTLRYERVEISTTRKIFISLVYAGAVFITLFAGWFFISIFSIFPTAKESIQAQELIQLKSHYADLGDKVDRMSSVLTHVQERDKAAHRLILGMDPIDEDIWKAGVGGSNRYEEFDNISNKTVTKNEVKNITSSVRKLEKQLAMQSYSLDTILKVAKNKEKMLASIPSIKPISKKYLSKSIHAMSGYGYRIHPIHKVRRMHTGIDFGARTGTPIIATGDAKVKKILKKRTGYGHHIILDHGYGYQTLYAHMSKIEVKVGQKVKKGEVIGKVGNTGTSTAPHLHYEVINKNKKVNPIHYVVDGLTPEEYENLVDQAKIGNQSFD